MRTTFATMHVVFPAFLLSLLGPVFFFARPPLRCPILFFRSYCVYLRTLPNSRAESVLWLLGSVYARPQKWGRRTTKRAPTIFRFRLRGTCCRYILSYTYPYYSQRAQMSWFELYSGFHAAFRNERNNAKLMARFPFLFRTTLNDDAAAFGKFVHRFSLYRRKR